MTDDADRKWLPAEWLDEVVPIMEASPVAYVEREGEGWALRLPKGNPSRSDDHEEDCWHTKIEPGQIVGFCWTEDYGHFSLTVDDDGRWKLDRPVPETATHFWLPFDTETLAESVEDLVKGNDWTGPTDPGTHTMGAYFWSDEVKFRFEISTDGQPRFVQCAEAN